MKLYNTLTSKVEEIKPLAPPIVTVYTCGPTVYDYPHIGNWFTFIRYDLLVRTLRAAGYQPKWVMNITDVGHLVSDADEGEDKLEKGARREGKTAWDVAKFYTDYFAKSMKRLNFTKPDFMPKATEHIPEQIELVQKLEYEGFTYIIDDGVYYDTSRFPRYGDFAKLDLDDLQAGARIELNPQKHNPTDFALWKFSPHDHKRDMEWDSPWGKGFPGWHLECSAMSMKYLGETLDIHSGGIDHIPVHHTNEIAQSEAATGKPFANYWMHTNHVMVEGKKISKSLGNSITLEDIEAKGFSLEAFRLHVLESHYRSQSKFSWQSLEAAQNRLKDLCALSALRHQPIASSTRQKPWDFKAKIEQVKTYMENDLHTPEVLGIDLFGASAENSTSSNATKNGSKLSSGIPEDQLAAFTDYIKALDIYLGLDLMSVADISDSHKHLIKVREQARQKQDWNTSDELRNQLEGEGIGLRDTLHGTIWYWLQ
jgi:cysteinyl-tRNA synthetase